MGEIKVKFRKGPCVYFITDGEYVKIGVTRDLESRFASIQGMNSRELKILHVIHTKDIFTIEQLLHTKYKDKHIRGEWYDVEDEVYRMIEEKKQKEAAEKEALEKKKQEAAIERERRRYSAYYTVAQIAELLRTSLKTAKKIVASNDFPTMNKIGDEDRVLISDFDEFIKRHAYGDHKLY